jgi:TDG/mug DNA glycosylase family protein
MAGAPTELKSSFPPVFDRGARVLVLGSLPGEVSLARQQYYAYPHNQFWRLIGHVLGRELPAAYDARLTALLEAGVGLWDVVRTATRAGSLDASIRGHEPNPLAEFVATLPSLRAVAFNGATASAIGRRALGEVGGVELVSLPSSSPAYTLAFERKAAAWATLRRFLET